MHIKRHRQVIRLLFLQDLEHDIQESIHRIGMKPLAVSQVRHSVESPIQYAVSIYQYKFFRHTLFLSLYNYK